MKDIKNKAEVQDNKLPLRVNLTLFYNDEDPQLAPERWWARRRAQNLN